MFEKINQDDLIQLTSVQEGPCVSIYIPNLLPKTLKVEYENLFRQAQHLLSFEKRSELKKTILDKLQQFQPHRYLNGDNRGLALFANKHWNAIYVSPKEFQSRVVVADSFHLKPLLKELQNSKKFYVLTLTLTEALMLQSDAGHFSETHNFLLHQSAHSSSIHWKHQDESDTFQLPYMQSKTRARGVVDDKFKKRSLHLFFKWIEAIISKSADYKSTPLIVFTNHHLFKAYKSLSSHPNPHLRKIEIGHGLPRTEFLIDQSNIEIKKIEATGKLMDKSRTSDLSSKGLLIDDIFKISKAALRGEIQTLYLQENIELWGRFHRQSGEIKIHEKQLDSHDDDILDDIACEVIRRGGEVIVLPVKEMPSSAPASALVNQ